MKLCNISEYLQKADIDLNLPCSYLTTHSFPLLQNKTFVLHEPSQLWFFLPPLFSVSAVLNHIKPLTLLAQYFNAARPLHAVEQHLEGSARAEV